MIHEPTTMEASLSIRPQTVPVERPATPELVRQVEVDPRDAGFKAVEMVAQILRRPRRRFVRLFVEAPMCWQREHHDLQSALVRLNSMGQ